MAKAGRPKLSADVTRACGTCGTSFTVPEWDRKRYCNPSCASKAKKGPYKAKYPKTCEQCHKAFMAVTPRRQYCSPECSRKAAYERNPQRQLTATKRWMSNNKARNQGNQKYWRRRERAEFVQTLWERQEGKCYLCKEPIELVEGNPRKLHVDHDHRCCPRRPGCVTCQRGLAHLECNHLIGYCGDDPDKLRFIADNLAAARTLVDQRMAAAAESQPTLWKEESQ